MPRCLRPNQKFPLSLKDDAGIAAEQRPTFYFRAVSADEFLDALDRVREAGGASLKLARDFLTEHLVGWANMVDHRQDPPQAVEFDPQQLGQILDYEEIVELFYGFTLSAEDKKKSE
jgi:hypothetical protein